MLTDSRTPCIDDVAHHAQATLMMSMLQRYESSHAKSAEVAAAAGVGAGGDVPVHKVKAKAMPTKLQVEQTD